MSAASRAFSFREHLGAILVRPHAASHLRPLDGVRALSILWVVLFHSAWYTWFSASPQVYRQMLGARSLLPIWRGDFGVDVFFVLSGFLIGGMLARELEAAGTIRVARFYGRRLLRLWPALAVAALLDLWLLEGPPRHALWPNLLYISNLFPLPTIRMAWTWSLAIEEQFYLAVPWLLGSLHAFARRTGRALLAGVGGPLFVAVLAAVGCAFVVLAYDLHAADVEIAVTRPFFAWAADYDLLYTKPWMRIGPLAAGLSAAQLHRSPAFMARLGKSGPAGIVLVLGALVLAVVATHWQWFAALPRALEVLYLVTFRGLFGAAVAALVLVSLSTHPLGQRLGRALSAPMLFPFAQLAYCAYLVNPIVATLSHHAIAPFLPSPGTAFVVLALVDVPITFGAALVLSVLVERPFMALRDAWLPVR